MIRLTQCLCPNDHCIVALPWDGTEADTAAIELKVRTDLAKAFALGVLNPWCVLCGQKSDSFVYRSRATEWQTIEEAMPHLYESEALQLAIAGMPKSMSDAVRAELRAISARKNQ